jgi:DNA-binding MarR family transcriptional regulator
MTTSTPTPTPTPAPALSARDIGAAARASQALLDRLLDQADLPFPEWTVLFTLDATGPLVRSELVRQQADGLKVPEATARATVDGLVASGLIGLIGLAEAAAEGDDPRVVPTAAGEAVFRPIRQEVSRIAGEIYGDLPPADLEVTRRTLEEVTRRASALLRG